ncbi:MAG TPA: hypothetical protein PLD30_03265, partial [Candidatus Competibacteraceae bacterium]|nr:hypothetical protein [Candidatus Competibacteraceae bacterium]
MWLKHPFYRLFCHPLAFIKRVFQGFQTNQGTLLAGAIAYNALLSLVPLVLLCQNTCHYWLSCCLR